MKKYELIKESKTIFEGREIYKIRALKNFSDVRTGDICGWVCSEDNLSQEGDCWIRGNAKCLDNARVLGNARMHDNAIMYDDTEMYDNSAMFDKAKMYDNAIMCCKAMMWGNARMYGNTRMYDNSIMFDNAAMYDNSEMYDNSAMSGNAKMYDDSTMCGKAAMRDNAVMRDNSRIYDNAKICGNAKMCNNAGLDKNKLLYGSINKSYKKIFQHHDEYRLLIAILTEENEILYSVGCQVEMTKEEFIDRIYIDCKIMCYGLEEYPHRQEYLDIIDMAENYLRKFI